MSRQPKLSATKRRTRAPRSVRSTCWVPPDPEQLRRVFDAFEQLTELRHLCARGLAAAREAERVLGHISLEADQFGLQKWRRLFDQVAIVWRLLDRTVRDYQLDPSQFQDAYRRMWLVRSLSARIGPRGGPGQLIERITDHLRQLLISYAQAQAQLRQPNQEDLVGRRHA